ncbi:recQ-mediated genome instability protein 1 [Dispira simplex]|nr:recQ-mediated genome instability protein 1 [Dispira simplex]
MPITFDPLLKELHNSGLLIRPEWLQACLQTLQNDHQLSPSAPEVDWQEAIYRQFLFGDLSMIALPSLPERCLERHATTLVPVTQPSLSSQGSSTNTVRVVQVQDMWDVGIATMHIVDVLEEREKLARAASLNMPFVPRVSNVLDQDGSGDEHDDDEERGKSGSISTVDLEKAPRKPLATPSGQRKSTVGSELAIPRGMLRLTLTDGHQVVPAMEYKPIPSLALDLPLGTKILLRNPPIRRGMLLLDASNCVVLGGMVKHLNTTSLLNRMYHKLGKEEKKQNPPTVSAVTDGTVPTVPPPDAPVNQSITPLNPKATLVECHSAANPISLDDDSDDIMSTDLEMFDQLERQAQVVKPKLINPVEEGLINPDDYDDDDFIKPVTRTPRSEKLAPPLKKLTELPSCLENQILKIRVQAKTKSIHRFHLSNDKFTLVTHITDSSTAVLRARLDSELIPRLTQITPEKLRQALDTQGTEESFECLKRIRKSILALDGTMVIDLTQQCVKWHPFTTVNYLNPEAGLSESELPVIVDYLHE